MYLKELEILMNEYKNATSKEDIFIKLKLESIASYCSKCDQQEFLFAKEIASEFCRVIHVLKERHKRELKSTNREDENVFLQLPNSSAKFAPYRDEGAVQYKCAYDLLGAFYNYFKKESELDYYEIDTYPFKNGVERKEKVNLTLLDYVARIRTFSNKYLSEIFSTEEILASNSADDILFIYDNIEYILVKFNTKNEKGNTIKQRANIKSALSKLNEFKYVKER